MKLESVISMDEARGSGSFDYQYWFWARKGTLFGIGYARQPIELDIERENTKSIQAVVDALDKRGAAQKSLEITDSKKKVNTSRVKGKEGDTKKGEGGIIDFLGSPVIVHWLSGIKAETPGTEIRTGGEKPTAVHPPTSRPGDVTTPRGEEVNAIRTFRDLSDSEAFNQVDWDRLQIHDEEGATQNTLIAKFVQSIVGLSRKTRRTAMRGPKLSDIMTHLKFKDQKAGVEIIPFQKADYALLPKEAKKPGGGEIGDALRSMMKNRFREVLKRARITFGQTK